MGREPAGVDFALIGHSESWDDVERLMGSLRERERPPLSSETIRDVFPWIPPRTVERLTVRSSATGTSARGVYIDTFIPPDTLGSTPSHRHVRRVEAAIDCAAREGARLASLGGFTSILLQRASKRRTLPAGLSLTTGNSLTAALTVRGVEDAAAQNDIPLDAATLLVIGSTGDVGSACARYLAPRVAELCLCGRNRVRLEGQKALLEPIGARVTTSTSAEELIPLADLVIAAASMSSPTVDLSPCRPHAIVCDVGYPKNTRATGDIAPASFWGGLGKLEGGWQGSRVAEEFYRFPHRGVAHGCMLEGMVLALEGRFEAFSQGHGRITPEKMDEIYAIAIRHGVTLAPFMNARGLWSDPELVDPEG